MTPESWLKDSPIAARISGVAARTVVASRPRMNASVKISDSSASAALARRALIRPGRRRRVSENGMLRRKKTRISPSISPPTEVGTPAAYCMLVAPISSAPNRIAAKSTPNGINPPSSATAIAVYPHPGEKFDSSTCCTPRIAWAPARPQRPPPSSDTRAIGQLILMPAKRAASGLPPTVRIS